MVKECALITGKLPLGGLPRNSEVRITDCPDMISAVNRGYMKKNLFLKPENYEMRCTCDMYYSNIYVYRYVKVKCSVFKSKPPLPKDFPKARLGRVATSERNNTSKASVFFIFRFTDPPDPIFWKLKKK